MEFKISGLSGKIAVDHWRVLRFKTWSWGSCLKDSDLGKMMMNSSNLMLLLLEEESSGWLAN